MVKLRYAAKLTQTRYGTSNQAAAREIFLKAIIVVKMVSQRNIISRNAPTGECKSKKIIDHRIFKNNWLTNRLSAILLSLLLTPFFQIRNSAIPMRANKIIHTGPNTQFGGASVGLIRLMYQVGIDGIVKIEPITPASSQKIIATINLVKFMIFIS